MTSGNSDTLQIENVPMPSDYRMKRESLPESITETLVQMKEEQSFFLPTDNKEHTARKSRALRSRIARLQNEYPEMRFSVRHDSKDGQMGVRVFKLGDDDASE